MLHQNIKTPSSTRQSLLGLGDDTTKNGIFLEIRNSHIALDWSAATGLEGSQIVTDNKWHLVNISVTSGTATLYLDGQTIGSFGSGTLNLVSTGKNGRFIGQRLYNDNIYPFSGQIDDISIFSRALSSQEISALYSGSLTTTNQTSSSSIYNNDNELTSSVSTSTLASSTSISYSYDSLGNLSSYTSGTTTKTFIWNNFGQLTAVKNNNATTSSFIYDSLGNRIAKISPSATIHYVNDVTASNAVVLEEVSVGSGTSSTTSLLRANVWGVGGLISTGGSNSTERAQ